MCSQTSGSSANFYWQHMQTGSRNPPKPEVVITRRREDISMWSQRLRHTHWACPIHFHLRQHRPTMENTIRCKPEVQTVSQTGSSINVATETEVDAISVDIRMSFGASFSLVYTRQPHPTLHLPINSEISDGYQLPEVVITLRRKPTSTWSQCSVGIRPPSWSLRVKEASGDVGMACASLKNLLLKTRYSHWDCVDICFCCWVISTSGLGLCFYFRFVPEVVRRSRTTSVPVEVDTACPKTVS